jgi:2-polyprenyl-3-methyl-5-hydroxy-6-metoxy-1,4-benzoquinol methylase
MLIMGKEKEFYKHLKPFLNCKDYTVSKEMYKVMLNEQYEMLVTTPVPADLENYYKSEAYISHTDSTKTLFDKAYQAVKNYALKKKVSLLDSFETEEKKVLDVGAGTGDFLNSCKKSNWEIFGVEPSLDAIKIAAKKNIFLKQNVSEFHQKKFDVITLWHVLEHIENLTEYIASLKKLLKENGTLVVAVPNYKSYDAKFYKEHWAAFDVPRHLWHFSQNSISKLFSQVSMRVVKTLPMKFDAYYVALLSEKYKSGTMNPFKSFLRGFQSNNKARSTSEYSSLIYIIKNN